MLTEAVAAARKVRDRLDRTMDDLKPRLPLDAGELEKLDHTGQLALDALLMQFFNIVTVIQDQLMRSILFAAGEDAEGQTRLDQRHAAERLGAWPAGLDFKLVARARNALAHQYPHDPARQVRVVNRVIAAIPPALTALDAMLSYVARRYPEI